MSLRQRFDFYIDLNGPIPEHMKHLGNCHVWTGAKVRGQGVITRLDPPPRKMLKAHRVAWEFAKKKSIPDGLCVLHKCDNRACVRISHLFLGTKGENNTDRSKKLRSATGKLSPQEVAEIRASNHIHDVALGKKYGVTRGTIEKIQKYKLWKYLP